MGHAIHYCTGCSIQLREPDFEKGGAFRSEARVYCKNCVPEMIRLRTQPPSPPERTGEGTGRIPRVTPAPSQALRQPEEKTAFPKWALAAGGAVVVLGLVIAMASSSPEPTRRQVEQTPPMVGPTPEPAPAVPPPPLRNEKAAEEAIRKARDFAQASPDDLTGQLALYDEAIRAAEQTGHHAAALREREGVVGRQKLLLKTQLDAVDAAVQAACDREEFGAALKRIDEARLRPLGSEWTAELARRSQSVTENAEKLFAAVKQDAAEAQKRGAQDEVKRLTERVAKWELDPFKSELAKAVTAATPKKPPPPPPARPIDAYRKKWAEAMTAGSFRDFPGALKKIEDARAATSDPVVQVESGMDLEFLRQAIAAEEEALKAIAKTPKGSKLTVTYLTEAGKVEATGTVVRNDGQEIELARDKGNVRIPLGEISSRTLGQAVKGKREDKGPAVLCLLDGDVEGAKGLVEGAAAIPDKYWSFKSPPRPAAQVTARKLFYAAERDAASPARAADAVLKYLALLKDHSETEFVRRNRALISSRAEGGREFFFVFEDLRIGGAFKALKSEKDELYWKMQTEGEAGRAVDNFVEITFSALPDIEYRCWFYVGGCCTEAISCSYQAGDPAEAGGEPLPVKNLPSMQFRTHAAHAGRGRPATRWGWISIPLPKFAAPGQKRVRLMTAEKGFCAAQALVSATRSSLPMAGELRDLERARLESRGAGGRPDPTLVGHWKFADGAGTVAVDSSTSGIDGKLVNGGTWMPGTASPWSPPSLRLEGKAYVDLGTNLALLQSAPGYTMAAWIHPDKIAGGTDQNKIFSLSKHNGATPTAESRAALTLMSGGHLSAGGRSLDSEKLQSLHTVEKVIKTGAWVHVAGVVDLISGTVTVYVNGAPQPTKGTVAFADKSTPNTRSTCAAIGSEEDAAKWTFQGRIADLRVYNRALSKEEIAELAAPGQALR